MEDGDFAGMFRLMLQVQEVMWSVTTVWAGCVLVTKVRDRNSIWRWLSLIRDMAASSWNCVWPGNSFCMDIATDQA